MLGPTPPSPHLPRTQKLWPGGEGPTGELTLPKIARGCLDVASLGCSAQESESEKIKSTEKAMRHMQRETIAKLAGAIATAAISLPLMFGLLVALMQAPPIIGVALGGFGIMMALR